MMVSIKARLAFYPHFLSLLLSWPFIAVLVASLVFSTSCRADTFILVSGAWLDSWYWSPVKRELEAKGHRVFAPDLPGHGADKAKLGEQTLESYARVVARIVSEQNEPVILVGHSMGGAVASQASEYAADRVRELVILCGFLPRDGESVNGPGNGVKPTDWIRAAESGVVRLSADAKVTFFSPSLARERFLSGLDAETARQALEHIGGESIAAQYQAAHLGSHFARVPKIYIKTLADRAFAPDLQDRMIERGVSHVYAIDSGHFPQLAKPSELASILLDIANSTDR